MDKSSGSSAHMVLPIFIADAFTSKIFRGNPAAVCLLDFRKAISPDVKQKIAAEMNLSETAFVSILKEGDTFEKDNKSAALKFETISGILEARQSSDGKIEIELPAFETKSIDLKQYEKVNKAAVGSLPVQEVAKSDNNQLLIRLQDNVTKQQFLDLRPSEVELLAGASDIGGVIITLKGTGLEDCKDDQDQPYDFLSRYFAPWFGVLEDPVCGSAHSVLGPFWSRILKKNELYARQCSTRGGDLNIKVMKNRVLLSGHAVIVVRGEISF